jgi:hypothetical protein
LNFFIALLWGIDATIEQRRSNMGMNQTTDVAIIGGGVYDLK